MLTFSEDYPPAKKFYSSDGKLKSPVMSVFLYSMAAEAKSIVWLIVYCNL